VSIFDNIKKAFVEDIPEPHKVPAPSSPPMPSSFPHPTATVDWQQHTQAAADPNARSKLEQKLKANTPPIYDNFLEQYEALESVIQDEATRFKAALKTSRCSLDQLTGAIDQMIAIMTTAHQEFGKSFEENKGRVLGGLTQQIEADKGLIVTRASQLKSIQEEIASLQTKITNEEQQVQSETARLNVIRTGFEAAHAQVVGRLNDQKQRIATQSRNP
jgi:chromosome segregation ATPase